MEREAKALKSRRIRAFGVSPRLYSECPCRKAKDYETKEKE